MTPTLSVTADRLAIYARAARKSHKASLAKHRTAVRTRALEMIYEMRRRGSHVPRNVERALRA